MTVANCHHLSNIWHFWLGSLVTSGWRSIEAPLSSPGRALGDRQPADFCKNREVGARMSRPSPSAYREIPAMKNLIPALFVLAFAATSAHAQSNHCVECDSVAASPADMPLSGVGAVAIGPAGLYGSGWNSTASGSDSDGFTSTTWKPTAGASGPGGVSAVSMPAAPANPMMKIDDARSTLGR